MGASATGARWSNDALALVAQTPVANPAESKSMLVILISCLTFVCSGVPAG
jgi:hypothetical protein